MLGMFFFSFFLSFLPLSQRKREKKGDFGFKYLLFEEGSFSFVIEKHLLHFVDSPLFSSPDTIQKWLVTQFPFSTLMSNIITYGHHPCQLSNALITSRAYEIHVYTN